jgi:3-dehydroquinate synthase
VPLSTQTVRVELPQRGYDIEIGGENLARAGQFLAARAAVSHAVIITDENVQEPHAVRVAEGLVGRKIEVAIVAVKPGEESKSLETAAGLWQGMLELGADRQTVVVAVGGGVVGDLAGFIAATYARGIRFLQVPTSLVAQVDSSVGGKVGVNLPGAKNMVGAFWQPLGVLVDTATLDTLPPREYRSGLGEVVKYGVCLDAELFDYLEAHAAELVGRNAEVLVHVIGRCCRLKADVVRRDEREESGHRAVLNYGHSFAHALETLTGYGKLLHGEAVAVGMDCAARLAEQLGRVDAAMVERQRKLLQSLGLPLQLPKLDREKIVAAMMHDKKTERGRLRLVLPSRLGQVELVDDVNAADIRTALEPEK